MSVEISPNAPALARAVAERLSSRVAEIQALGRTPRVVLTGGTIAIEVYEALSEGEADWTDVDFYWGDERFVPDGHADRNDRQAREAFLTRLAVPTEHIHAMPAHDCALSAEDAAAAYSTKLPAEPFDVVLLGLGPDGHVASLFPGSDQLHKIDRRVVEVLDSPKPPPVRVSLSLPTLNDAHAVWFLVSGQGKAAAVARAHGAGTIDDTPAVGVTGLTETLWFLDEDAASGL